MKQHPLINTGFIEQPPFLTDWVAGGESGVVEVNLQPTGQWSVDLPTEEKQRNDWLESNLCVTFSGLNTIETIVNHKIKSGQFSASTIQKIKDLGFLDENGIFNCNEMFSANLNGSTPNGNALGNFWLSARRDGLLPQKDWKDVYNDIHSYSDLYVPVPQNLKDKAQKILEILDINYHWVLTGVPNDQTLVKYLKQSPLHIATPVCEGWNSGNVGVCDDRICAHATMLYGYDSGVCFKDFDHYSPFQKKLMWGYFIPYAIACTVNEKKTENPTKPFYQQWFKSLEIGSTGADVVALQKVLIYEGFLNKDLCTGYFGTNTKNAVMKFQQKYASDILTPYGLSVPTGYVGPKTIHKLNWLYSSGDVQTLPASQKSDWLDAIVGYFKTWWKK